MWAASPASRTRPSRTRSASAARGRKSELHRTSRRRRCTFTVGFVIEEQSVQPVTGGRDERYDPEERRARLGAEYPLLGAVSGEMFRNYEACFGTGPRIVVAGIAETLAPDGAR
ncbi:TetR/AcrR family transcriptional regulator C-terminal domain-containing protein [Streptomyces sp. NPDC046977]|uniref:TetR/AcrR family transcriptional regulator C-terminal domain-containing protein n=1 Tax=Streptomyces sp. NPDC046977 TaxID=3154703 RepID=UPI0033E8AF58